MGDLIGHSRHHPVEPLKKFGAQIDALLGRLIEAEVPAELVSSHFIDEVIGIGAEAEALRCCARQARLGLTAQNRCACIRCRAERRIGQILNEIDRARVGRPRNDSRGNHLRLIDLGITPSLSHRCRRLAAIPQWEFDGLLRRALDRNFEITTRWLLNMAEARQRREQNLQPQVGGSVPDLHAFIAAGNRMRTIYMDPPWEIEGVPALHYPTMTVEEIRALPIPKLANPDRCHLHIWTLPGRTQRLACDLIESWGFRVVSEFSWRKGRWLGQGSYYRMCHEDCLLAVWADRDDRFDDQGLPSCDEFPRGRHSEKPDEVRRRIERASPGPRIELFARREVPGWYSWGYEIPTLLGQQIKKATP